MMLQRCAKLPDSPLQSIIPTAKRKINSPKSNSISFVQTSHVMRTLLNLLLLPCLVAACADQSDETALKNKDTLPQQTPTQVVTKDPKSANLTANNTIEQPKVVKFEPPKVIPPIVYPDPDPYPEPFPVPYGDPYEPVPPPEPISKPQGEEIYDVTEVAPEFPGGQQALLDYLKNNIHYPEEAKEIGLMGKVYVGFVVRNDGSISNVEIKRGVHALLDKEAVRVIKNMPKWKPGMNGGKAVNCRMILPIKFELDH